LKKNLLTKMAPVAMDEDVKEDLPKPGEEKKERLFHYTFAKFFTIDRLKLIEVENEMVDDIVSGNGTLEIRGGPDDEAFLIHRDQCYKMETLETSNTCLLIEEPVPGDDTRVAVGGITQHYTIQKMIPKVAKLRAMLAQPAYDPTKKPDPAALATLRLYTFEALQDIIQASDAQIKSFLAEISAIEIDGHWRLLAKSYYSSVFDDIIISVQEQNLPVDKVNLEAVLTTTTDYDKQMVGHVLRMFSKPAPPDATTFELSEERVCLYRADQIITQNKKTPMKRKAVVELVDDWLPFGLNMKDEYLTGHYLSNAGSLGDDTLLPFEEKELSMNGKKRFTQLFNFKDTWEEPELRIYLKSLLDAGEDFDKLLLKNSRVFKERIGDQVIKVYRTRGTAGRKRKH